MSYVEKTTSDVEKIMSDLFFTLVIVRKTTIYKTRLILRKILKHSAMRYFPAAPLALNARAYMRICFCIDSSPLLRVGERWSRKPILSMK